MIVTCPTCATRYELRDDSIKPGGRNVRCASCGHRWLVRPAGEVADRHRAAPAPDAGAEMGTTADEARLRDADDRRTADGALSDRAESGDDRFETVPTAPVDAETEEVAAGTRRSSFLTIAGWLLVLLLVVLLAGLVVARNSVVDSFPSSLPVYRTLGLPIDLKLGLELGAIETETATEEGMPVLVIRGDIRNVTSRARQVPAIRIGLLDAEQTEIDHDYAAPETRILEGGAETSFELRYVAPPPEARNLAVTFDVPEDFTSQVTP